MFRHLTLAAVSLAIVSASPVPVLVGTAQAQNCGPLAVAGAPCRPPNGSASTYDCSTQLGYLRRVYEEDLDNIEDPNLVSVVPICVGESYGVMRADGNAGALRNAIADNDAITEALFLKNFGPDDVVGIRMTDDDTATFYVHPMHNM